LGFDPRIAANNTEVIRPIDIMPPMMSERQYVHGSEETISKLEPARGVDGRPEPHRGEPGGKQVLKSIDVLIGLIVILLALSMAVTVITQAVTTVINSRGRHLRRGLADLLKQLDPVLTETVARDVATRILRHPLVSGSSVPVLHSARLGNVIHREEFTKLLIALATGDASVATDAMTHLTADVKTALRTALKNQGVSDPDKTLADIRALALGLERSAPQLSNMARQNLAILRAAQGDLVGKINSWFDQTMDRTSQRFTASTRAITFAGAFLVAFGLQVDTPSLVNRLAADDKLREAFVQQGRERMQTPASRPRPAGASTTPRASDSDSAPQQSSGIARRVGRADAVRAQTTAQPNTGATDSEQLQDQSARESNQSRQSGEEPRGDEDQTNKEQEYRAFLAENGIIKLPSAGGWTKGFDSMHSVLGMLVTALLLSLGAPFWYNALAQLLQLRSVLAFKDDEQRTSRQTNEPAVDSGRPVSPAVTGGERGDAAPVG
jgi:hypothetical protein